MFYYQCLITLTETPTFTGYIVNYDGKAPHALQVVQLAYFMAKLLNLSIFPVVWGLRMHKNPPLSLKKRIQGQ